MVNIDDTVRLVLNALTLSKYDDSMINTNCYEFDSGRSSNAFGKSNEGCDIANLIKPCQFSQSNKIFLLLIKCNILIYNIYYVYG